MTKNLGGQLAKEVRAIYITDAKIAVIGATSSGSPMSALSLVLNLLWIIFGGLWMAFGWVIALLPFGYKAVSRAGYSGREDIGTGPLGLLGNVIWLVLAGWWLALGHVVTAVLLAVTIIGIPFAWAHLKLAGLALWPIGKMIVPADDTALPYARRW